MNQPSLWLVFLKFLSVCKCCMLGRLVQCIVYHIKYSLRCRHTNCECKEMKNAEFRYTSKLIINQEYSKEVHFESEPIEFDQKHVSMDKLHLIVRFSRN